MTTTTDSRNTPPASGTHQLRVRYVECDPMGVVHHSSYLPWMEIGRTELLRDVGESYATLEVSGVFMVVTKAEIKYRRPLRYDDVIEIRTKVEKASKVKLHHSYEIVLIERDGQAPDFSDPAVPTDGVCASGSTELACVGSDGRPKGMPEWLTGN
ncbi:MAG: acyl-CoA thioesterase [Phycisphaerales bacterium]